MVAIDVTWLNGMDPCGPYHPSRHRRQPMKRLYFMACMTKLRAADPVIGGTHLDVVLSMVQSGVSLEIVPTAPGLEESLHT